MHANRIIMVCYPDDADMKLGSEVRERKRGQNYEWKDVK